MVVYKDNKGSAYNVKKDHLHFWTGSRMMMYMSSIGHFKKNVYHQEVLKAEELKEKELVKKKQTERRKEEFTRKMNGLGIYRDP